MIPIKKPSGQTWAKLAYEFRERAEKAEAEVETLRAAIDGEPWGGAVLKRQRDVAVKQLGVTLEQLWTAEKERDEARVELVSLAQQLEREKASATRGWQMADELHLTVRDLNAEVERLERLFQQTHGVHHTWVDARHKVAEAQREACAKVAYLYADLNYDSDTVEAKVRATPLVTEGNRES